MRGRQDRLIKYWIALFGSLAVVLVIYGGFVRLTRSGLSIVEWNPVSGTLPPLSPQAWELEFAKYQTTPEYQQINRGMALADYRQIFLVEWTHRIMARFAGMVFAVPFSLFLLTRRIRWRESPVYFGIATLFLAQAVMGWAMVSSGLVDRPSVSHVLLAAHLFLALSLIGVSAWVGLGHHYGFPHAGKGARWSRASFVTLLALLGLLLQMAYGAFTAGLKAGYVSNTWPLMLGRLIPHGLLRQIEPPLSNILEAPLTVAFIHRWLAIGALVLAAIAYAAIRRAGLAEALGRAPEIAAVLAVFQIGLGIAVVLTGVNLILALLHQLNAILLFLAAIFLLHRLRSRDAGAPPGESSTAQ